jgi:hypothetical protein
MRGSFSVLLAVSIIYGKFDSKRPIYLHQHTVSLQLLGTMSAPPTFVDSQDPMLLKPGVSPVFPTSFTLLMFHEITDLIDNYAACL